MYITSYSQELKLVVSLLRALVDGKHKLQQVDIIYQIMYVAMVL
jgi:hypothetical protein